MQGQRNARTSGSWVSEPGGAVALLVTTLTSQTRAPPKGACNFAVFITITTARTWSTVRLEYRAHRCRHYNQVHCTDLAFQGNGRGDGWRGRRTHEAWSHRSGWCSPEETWRSVLGRELEAAGSSLPATM
jgi:hypothetical protein